MKTNAASCSGARGGEISVALRSWSRDRSFTAMRFGTCVSGSQNTHMPIYGDISHSRQSLTSLTDFIHSLTHVYFSGTLRVVKAVVFKNDTVGWALSYYDGV